MESGSLSYQAHLISFPFMFSGTFLFYSEENSFKNKDYIFHKAKHVIQTSGKGRCSYTALLQIMQLMIHLHSR